MPRCPGNRRHWQDSSLSWQSRGRGRSPVWPRVQCMVCRVPGHQLARRRHPPAQGPAHQRDAGSHAPGSPPSGERHQQGLCRGEGEIALEPAGCPGSRWYIWRAVLPDFLSTAWALQAEPNRSPTPVPQGRLCLALPSILRHLFPARKANATVHSFPLLPAPTLPPHFLGDTHLQSVLPHVLFQLFGTPQAQPVSRSACIGSHCTPVKSPFRCSSLIWDPLPDSTRCFSFPSSPVTLSRSPGVQDCRSQVCVTCVRTH